MLRTATLIATFATLSLALTATSGAPYYYGRKGHGYYGPYPAQGYYKYYYYYRPVPRADYKYHYCYYYPRDRYGHKGYYYYYNPHQGHYWGRCRAGSDNYELLPKQARAKKLSKIPDKAFQPQGKMTNVPGMKPSTQLMQPPPAPSEPPPDAP